MPTLPQCACRQDLVSPCVVLQAGNIHKSLLTLSCVIRGLADNQVRPPATTVLAAAAVALWLARLLTLSMSRD